MRILPRLPLYSAAVAMATAGTVLLAVSPVSAEFKTEMALADDWVDCNPPTEEKDGLTAEPWTDSFIGLQEAHQYNQGTFSDNTPVTIAVIDSGVQADVGSFADGQVLDGFDAWDADSLGKCDAWYHGTGVAAIAAGQAEGEQFIGVAPKANILPIRAFQSNEGTDGKRAEMVGNLIKDAVNSGADVINISSVLPNTSDLKEAVDYAISKDVVIVAASGNGNLDMDAKDVPQDDAKYYPANYPGVIAVGAHNKAGNWYNKTNYGENLDLLAPGEGVTFPWAGGGWFNDSGTSFAAPFVAGAAALLKGEYGKGAKPAWIEKRLTETALHPPNDFNVYQGHGVLNIAKALTTPLAPGEDPTAIPAETPTDAETSEPAAPQAEPSTIAAIDVDYDPLALEKTIAWSSVGGALVLITLVLVLRSIIPKGRKRGWRPGTRKSDHLPVKVEEA